MRVRPYLIVSGSIFLAVGLLHLLRLACNWQAQIDGWLVPEWVSYIGCPIAWGLAVWAYALSRR
jgi:hypothetical protein